MIIQSGGKAGKSTQELFLKEADWVHYFVTKQPTSKISEEFRRHDKKLTTKPFVEKCARCDLQASRMSAYRGDARGVMFWCDDCDPYSQGARQGMLDFIQTFKQAVRFVDFFCGGRREDKRALVRRLAQAKGLPARVNAKVAEEFLR